MKWTRLIYLFIFYPLALALLVLLVQRVSAVIIGNFHMLPQGDDSWWNAYAVNDSIHNIFHSRFATRPRFFVNTMVQLGWQTWPNADMIFMVLMITGNILLLVSIFLATSASSGALAAVIACIFLLSSTIYSYIFFQRSVYLYTLWAAAFCMAAVAAVALGRLRKSRIWQRSFAIIALLFLVLAATCRESMYFAIPGLILFFAYPYFLQIAKKLSWPQRILMATAATLLLFAALLVVPFLRNAVLRFFHGKSDIIDFGAIAPNVATVGQDFAIIFLVLSFTLSGFLWAAKKWLIPFAFLLMITAAMALFYAYGHGDTFLLGKYLFVLGTLFCLPIIFFIFAPRQHPAALLAIIMLPNFALSLLVRGCSYYFFEAIVLGVSMCACLLVEIWREGRNCKVLSMASFFSIFILSPYIWKWGKEIHAQNRWIRDEKAWRQGLPQRELDAFANRPHPTWEYVLSPEMGKNDYNYSYWYYSVAAVAAVRAGHTMDHHLPSYSTSDFVIPFPHGQLGRFCLVKKDEKVADGGKTFEATFHRDQILIGARLKNNDKNNLYNIGKKIGQGASDLSRFIPVTPGRQYMLGFTIEPEEDASNAMVMATPLPGAQLNWEFPISLQKGKRRLFYTYISPYFCNTVLIEPNPIVLENNKPRKAKCLITNIFFVDVTVFSTSEQLNMAQECRLGMLWND